MITEPRGLIDIPPIMMEIFVNIHRIDITGARPVIKERSGYNENDGAIVPFVHPKKLEA
jgi:hypothetical protein